MRLPNGFGSVSKMGGKRRKPYIVRKGKAVVGYASTRSEGIEMLVEFNKNPHSQPSLSDATFSKVFELWNENKRGTISEHTAKNYDSKYRTVCQPLYDIPYKDLTLADFMGVINGFKGSNGSKKNIKNFFRAMDRVAYEFGIIDRQCSEFIPSFELDYRERVPFSEEEIGRLWESVEGVPDVDLVLILIYTGLRSGEFVDLRLSNIDLEAQTLKGGNKTDAGKNRVVPIHPRILPLIEARMGLSKGETLLNYGGKAFRARFKKAMKALGMEHIPHECRHTLRTRLDDAGANQKCIDLILGHASSGSEGQRTYTHKTLNQLREAILLLE